MADAPYLSMQRFNGNGTTTDWTVNFAGNTPSNENWYIKADDIEAIEVIPATLTAAEVRIERAVTRIGPSQFRVTPAVASGRILVLRRKTENRFNLVDFQSLQAVSEYDLDLANKQLLFVTQEASDQARLAEDRSMSAEVIAYSSVNAATEALTTSQDARNRAINAQTVAGSAQTAAANAVSTANSANTTASAANTTANAARSTANTALTTANAADAKANQAISTANSATATANGASGVALAASADAAAARDAAKQAELAASSAQTISQAAQTAATNAVNTANAAATTANAIDGKAQEALYNSTYAAARADLAMTLVEDAGVGTFNGRAGVVVPEAGDYTAAQISHGTGSNVEEALQDLSDYDTVLQQHITSEVNRVSTDFTNQLNSIAQAKLDKSGNAATATKLQTARTINGVAFDGSANITVHDSTKLPLTGGTLTGTLNGTRGIFTGNGNDFASGGLEVVGNGPSNTVFPTIGFHQPGMYASSIQLRGGGDFRFYAQGGASYASVTAANFNGTTCSLAGRASVGDVLSQGWLRTVGAQGWYNETYGGGIYMQDATYVRVYNGKAFYCAGNEIVLEGNSPTMRFYDNNWGNRYVHCNDGLIGFLSAGGGWTFRVDNDGNSIATGNVTAYSDIRLKTDIQVIPDALAKVCALRGVTYERIDTGERQTGVIAQEVQAVLPEAVMDGEHLSVAYGNMVGLLIEAVKELAAKVKELEDASTK